MRTIPAREIKRRGISAVDEPLKEGPVHVIKNDWPRYVIMGDAHYAELVEAQVKAEVARIRDLLADVATGRVRRVTAQQLVEEYSLAD